MAFVRAAGNHKEPMPPCGSTIGVGEDRGVGVVWGQRVKRVPVTPVGSNDRARYPGLPRRSLLVNFMAGPVSAGRMTKPDNTGDRSHAHVARERPTHP